MSSLAEKEEESGLNGIAERLAAVRNRIGDCAVRVGRSADEIRLIAVSKTHPAETVRTAIAAGAADLGENRVQEAEGKIAEIGQGSAQWHLIGPLQGNKARRAVNLFDVIHSLNSIELAQRLERLCAEENRAELSVLIQLALANEATKSGILESELAELVDTVRRSERLRLVGLMTLPPYSEDPEATRHYFRRLRQLRDGLKAEGAFGESIGELSMGMSHDFPVAIEEGATMVRIGTAIFGERP